MQVNPDLLPYLRDNPYLQMGFGEEDDEFDAIIRDYIRARAVRPPAPRVFRDRANPMEEFNEEEFRARFRVTKHAATGMLYIYIYLKS